MKWRLPFRRARVVHMLVGLAVAASGGHNLIRGLHADENWSITEGFVLSSDIKSRSGRGGTSFHPEVRYKYTATYTDFVGDKVSFTDIGLALPGVAERIKEKYPPGSHVVVYYDSDSPSRAVLEPLLWSGFVPHFLLGLALLAYGAWPLVRRSTKGKPAFGSKST